MDFLSKSSVYFKHLKSNIKAMEPANQLIRTHEAHDEVQNFSLELLRDKTEYLGVKADFFENQTLILNQIIHKMEMKNKELSKEEQELTEKLEERAEVKKKLVKILKGLKNQRKVREHKKKDEIFIRINGFYHCSECSFKTKCKRMNLKRHINAVHRKLKPWNCSDCTKGKRIKTYNLK